MTLLAFLRECRPLSHRLSNLTSSPRPTAPSYRTESPHARQQCVFEVPERRVPDEEIPSCIGGPAHADRDVRPREAARRPQYAAGSVTPTCGVVRGSATAHGRQ